MVGRNSAVHAELSALDNILQGSARADELTGLNIFLAKASKEDFSVTGSISIVVDIDVNVGSSCDVRVGDTVPFVEQ